MSAPSIPGLVSEKTAFSAVSNGQTLYFQSLDSLKAFMQGRQGHAPLPEPGPVTSQTPEALLLERFGYAGFRAGQGEAIAALLARQSVVAIMPTGTGKSICYQLPALMLPGLTVVVSPSIALMKDQVASLTRRGIPATMITSQLEPGSVRERLDDLRHGRYRLVFISPERFGDARFMAALAQVKVSLFAVDEAHCISEWGHNFRPAYLELARAIAACGRPPVLAATATATPAVREDIIRHLGLSHPKVIVTGFSRPNLAYSVRQTGHRGAKFEQAVAAVAASAGSVIVYAGTKARVEDFAARLRRENLGAAAYHAGLPEATRTRAQDEFMAGRVKAIVATNAFGMGVDKPDVRLVLHLDMPKSVEAYYQESGRAGRDGKPAECLLLVADEDESAQRYLVESGYPVAEVVRKLYRLLGRLGPDEPLTVDMLCDRLDDSARAGAVETALKYLRHEKLIEQKSREAGGMATELRSFTARVSGAPGQDPFPREVLESQSRLKRAELDRLHAMQAYVHARDCRQASFLRYFGEAATACGRCDLCKQPRRDSTPGSQRAPRTASAAPPLPLGVASAVPAAPPAHEGAFSRNRVSCPYCFGKVLQSELLLHCRSKHRKDPPAT